MPKRAALTLVELLVTVAIISLLTAVSIPLLAPNAESRSIREAARGVSVFLATARAKAIETGRPAGVIIQPLENGTPGAVTLFHAEEPPKFSGLVTDAKVSISNVTAKTLTLTFNAGGIPADFCQPQDTIKLNHQGHTLDVVSVVGNPVTSANVIYDGFGELPWRNGMEAAYQISRSPVRSASEPYQLPGGMAIDLSSSTTLAGSGDNQSDFGNVGESAIMFNPDGSIESIHHPTEGKRYPRSPVYLLIAPPSVDGDNWTKPTNLWVSINPHNGQTNVAEVAGGAADVIASRALVMKQVGLSGR